MNTRQSLLSIAMACALAPAPALAQERGFFAGLDLAAGTASGSSNTRDGGAAFAGGGVVRKVKFGGTTGIGGHLGYRFGPEWSVLVSYQHVRGDIDWDADFPLFGVASGFSGKATSQLLMGHVAYDWALSASTAIRATAGLGLASNTLSNVVETDKGSGLFLSDVAKHTETEPAAMLGIGVQHRLRPKVLLSVDATVSYVGGFRTGDTRSGNLGVTPITPYKIDDVWRAGIGAAVRWEF